MIILWICVSANNSGTNKRQITDLVDQSIQINTQCFVVTADNRYILVCGFWDKSFRVYSSDTGQNHLLDVKPIFQLYVYICSLLDQINVLKMFPDVLSKLLKQFCTRFFRVFLVFFYFRCYIKVIVLLQYVFKMFQSHVMLMFWKHY